MENTCRPTVVLGPLFERAWRLANTLHAQDTRKGTRIPYVSHLLGVASLVLELGGDEEQAAAALLHDALEDHPDQIDAARLEAEFGARVARIVVGCSDSFEFPKPAWQDRKRRYIEYLETAHPDVLLVSLADKTHNARAIATDVARDGRGTFDRFTGKEEGTLWYYRALVNAFARRDLDVRQLDAAVRAMEPGAAV